MPIKPEKPYRPSNFSEGEGFMEAWCNQCERDRAYRESEGCEPGCEILVNTMAYEVDDPRYPVQWVYGQDGKPRCTAFIPEGETIPFRDDKTIDMFE